MREGAGQHGNHSSPLPPVGLVGGVQRRTLAGQHLSACMLPAAGGQGHHSSLCCIVATSKVPIKWQCDMDSGWMALGGEPLRRQLLGRRSFGVGMKTSN